MELPPSLRCRAYGVDHDGICLLLELGPHRVLLDCGLSDLKPLQQDLAGHTPTFVFCSHAHAEHVQGLSQLRAWYPELPMYTSEVTAALVTTQQEASEPTLNLQGLPWRSPIHLTKNATGQDDLHIQLFPAGHLPGAAAILLTYSTPDRTYTILYTGDFCRTNFRLTEGLNIESLRGATPDVLILEGSYGTTQYPHHRQQEKHFLATLDHHLNHGQSILLLTPALGLAQEILILLRSHHQFTGRDLDIWVDQPVARICDTYLDLFPHLPMAIQNFARHQQLFWDTQVLPRMQRLHHPSTILTAQSPLIVVSDRWPDWFNTIDHLAQPWCVFVPEPLLNQLTVDLKQQPVKPQAIVHYCLTEHNDGPNTLQFIHNIRPQHIIFVHGSPLALEQLTGLVELQNRYQLHWPSPQTTVELPLGDRFLHPSLPLGQPYVGEIQDSEQHIILRLPRELKQSPQWLDFANTGVIEARWQDNELHVRGLSQQQLLEQAPIPTTAAATPQCQTCQSYQQRVCSNSRSPLYQRQVSPDGDCAEYQRSQTQGESGESDGFG